MMRKVLLITLVLVSAVNIFPSSDTLQIRNSDVVVIAEKLNLPITLDGKLDEPVWSNQNGFNQFHSERS